MKTKPKNKPLVLTAALAMLALLLLTGTYAWFTAKDDVVNKLSTQDALANVKIVETFVQPDDWKPGQTTTKEVAITNTGSAPALVRVSFDELLKIQSITKDVNTIFSGSKTDPTRPLTEDVKGYWGSGTPVQGGWFEVTTTPNATMGGVSWDYAPASAVKSGVKVYAKYNSTTGTTGSYQFAVVAPITAGDYKGEYQVVSYEKEWVNASKKLLVDVKGFSIYDSAIQTESDWGDGGIHAGPTKPASTNITKSDAESLMEALGKAPAGSYKGNIVLNYSANQVQTLADNTWYYNDADGYFYYIGAVKGGESSGKLLESVKLKETADGKYYANMDYELTVYSHAIQNTKDAVTGEWGLSSGSLYNALIKFCES